MPGDPLHAAFDTPGSWSDEAWEGLPSALGDLREAIRASRRMLALGEDWDEAGSRPIREETWVRAVRFLVRSALSAWREHGVVMDTPDITPGPEGSVDLHWDNPAYELLVNIPADPKAAAGFYGDDRGSISIKGKLDPDRANEGLIQWLRKPAPAAGR